MTTKKYCIYRHITPSGKMYIGITCQKPEHRWSGTGKGYAQSPAFYRAIQKYGWENIKHEVVAEELTEIEAKLKEKELIAKYKTQDKLNGYNITAGGDGMSNPTEETRRKLSLSHIGKQPTLGYRHTSEAKEKISNASKGNTWNIGRVASEETKRKLSEIHKGNKYNLGKKASIETRKKLSEAHRGKIYTEEERRKIGISNSISVNQYALSGEYIKTHTSACDAAREISGSTHSHINDCCNGKRISWKSYQWRHDTGDNRKNIEAVDIGVKSGAKHPRSRPVERFTRNGVKLCQYDNAVIGAKEVDGYSQNIIKCCQGKIKTAYGYIWRYAE